MYANVFVGLTLNIEVVMPYEGRSLQTFHECVTHPWCTKEFSVSIGEGRNKKTVKVLFLILSSKTVYNGILGHFLAALDMVASTIHLKMKFHNYFGEPASILTDLCKARLTHRTVSRDPYITSVIICKYFGRNKWNYVQQSNKYVEELSKVTKEGENWTLKNQKKKEVKSKISPLEFSRLRCCHRRCDTTISLSWYWPTHSRCSFFLIHFSNFLKENLLLF